MSWVRWFIRGSKATVRPRVFEVMVQESKKSATFPSFYTDDEELANRLARAITHAVELCTPDKKPEPF
jgi:hypothetical protein